MILQIRNAFKKVGENMINFDKLLGKIKEKKLTQQEYCNMCGISVRTFNNYRKKPDNIRIEFIEKNMQVLGLSKTEMNDIFFTYQIA